MSGTAGSDLGRVSLGLWAPLSTPHRPQREPLSELSRASLEPQWEGDITGSLLSAASWKQ